MKKNTIAIIDDHTLIAKALCGIISNFQEFEVIFDCENGKELIEKLKIKSNIPSLVLLDISMPIMDGFETAKWLNENHPDVKIMALSMQDDDESVIKMIKNGANGYMLKNTHPAELEKALTLLMQDGYYYPEWASKIVYTSLNQNKTYNDDLPKLTERELEFLKYSTTDLSYKEIAEKMFCSPRTIESYRDHLFEKLEVKSRVGLAVFALKNGLAE